LLDETVYIIHTIAVGYRPARSDVINRIVINL
jgi:hypothetical protein